MAKDSGDDTTKPARKTPAPEFQARFAEAEARVQLDPLVRELLAQYPAWSIVLGTTGPLKAESEGAKLYDMAMGRPASLNAYLKKNPPDAVAILGLIAMAQAADFFARQLVNSLDRFKDERRWWREQWKEKRAGYEATYGARAKGKFTDDFKPKLAKEFPTSRTVSRETMMRGPKQGRDNAWFPKEDFE